MLTVKYHFTLCVVRHDFAGKEGVSQGVAPVMRSWMIAAMVLVGCGGGAGTVSATPADPALATPVSPALASPTLADPAPADPTPVDPAPEDPRPADTISDDATPADPAPADATSDDATPADAAPHSVTYASATPSTSTSIGGPNEGHLTGGVPLPRRAPGLLSNPRRPNAEAYFGTYELIHSLVEGAAAVHRALPGGTLTINDIGFREGGTIAHHGSHRAGRDVDALFYMLDLEGQPRPSMAVPIDLEGRGTDYGDLVDPADDVPMQLDVARTWRFVQSLLEDDDALVQRIFVVEHVRTMLLAEAARAHAPRAILRRFEDVSCQPGYPHDDHLHVRYFCTNEDLAAGCEDASPVYPWRREQLAAAGLEPVIAHPRRRSRETAPTSPPEGTPMDAAVAEFLARRETWAHQPHPGRPYCR